MAGGRIKGITVEIGGDTVGLNKALSEVNAESRSLQGELRAVERLLQFDPENTNLLAQRQEILSQAVHNTSQRLETLRSVQQQVERQFEQGEIGVEQFRRFQRQIAQAENDLRRFEGAAEETSDEVKKSFKDMGSEIGSAIGGAIATMGAAEIAQTALDTASLKTTIDVSMDLPEEEKEAVYGAIKAVEAYGIDAEEALNGVRSQWKNTGSLTAAENEKIVLYAATIKRAYDEIDLDELIDNSNKMALGMEMTHEEALGMQKALLDMGFPPDQIDIISEYGQQLTRAGYDAAEIQNIFAAGIETGTWNIDNLMDGLKEGRILLSEFGAEVPKALQESLKGTEISAEQVKGWGRAMAEGGDAGKTAMMDVGLALAQVKDEVKRNELGVQMFGGMWEEQGSMITETILGAKDHTADLGQNVKDLGTDMQTLNADPAIAMKQALNDMNEVLTPLLLTVADWIKQLAEWIAQNPTLTASIVAVVTVLGILIGICMALAPIFVTMSGFAAAFGVTVATIAAPVLIVIAVLAALIAIGVAVWKNWDTISAKAKELGQKVMKAFTEWKEGVKERLEQTKEDIQRIWGKVMTFFKGIDLIQIGKDIIGGLIKGIGSMGKELWNKAKELGNGIGKSIKSALKVGSPSKIMIGIGEDTGEGLIVGLANRMNEVAATSERLADSITTGIGSQIDSLDYALTNYFEAIRIDGDWMNDWITHLPKQMRNQVLELGKANADQLDRSNSTAEALRLANQAKAGLTVNLHSPKALDIREANKEFNRTLNKMSLQW